MNLDPILKDRILEAIRKARTFVALVDDPVLKQEKMKLVDDIDSIFATIIENDWPCPPHLVAKVDEALQGIEEAYNKTASN